MVQIGPETSVWNKRVKVKFRVKVKMKLKLKVEVKVKVISFHSQECL